MIAATAPSPANSFQIGNTAAIHRRCAKTFTVAMALRAIAATYRLSGTVTALQRAKLRYYIACQRNPNAKRFLLLIVSRDRRAWLARRADAKLTPFDGWAIPEPIVMCESHGENLPPNGDDASGYYQIIPSTWQANGGDGSAAYLSVKPEQDRVASRIWDGGRGASQWTCAGLVSW